MYIADIFSEIVSSDFAKYVIGSLVAGSTYLLVMKIADKLTANLVRKDELKAELETFKIELTKELVTSQDLKVFKLEQEAAFAHAMTENRHAMRNEAQAIVSAASLAHTDLLKQVSEIKVVLARLEEHLKPNAEKPPAR